jgi:hypothetical protein
MQTSFIERYAAELEDCTISCRSIANYIMGRFWGSSYDIGTLK